MRRCNLFCRWVCWWRMPSRSMLPSGLCFWNMHWWCMPHSDMLRSNLRFWRMRRWSVSIWSMCRCGMLIRSLWRWYMPSRSVCWCSMSNWIMCQWIVPRRLTISTNYMLIGHMLRNRKLHQRSVRASYRFLCWGQLSLRRMHWWTVPHQQLWWSDLPR